MTEELFRYYDRELTFWRSVAASFAARYPKAANRLESWGAKPGNDPHVERLLQVRVSHTDSCRLDDDFPDIAEALLGVLYPHYVRLTSSLCRAVSFG